MITKNSYEFQRKIYTKSMSILQADEHKPRKKIIPTSKISGLREEFKKTFLPLLIDVFELRQMVENYKAGRTSSLFSLLGKNERSPADILQRLKEMQSDIEESKRWCEGVIVQVSKGIQEAKEALELMENNTPPEVTGIPVKPQHYQIAHPKKNFWQRLFKKNPL